MSLSKILFSSLAIATATASAIPAHPTKVTRQDPAAAEPSDYPLEGGACGHEWKYFNFDPASDGDKSKLQKLHDIICKGELRAISSWGAGAALDSKTSINVVYDVFFDTAEDTNTKVEDVLRKISGLSSTDGSVGEIVDFGVEQGNSCGNEGTLAYTLVDEDDGREKMHFCDTSYDRQSASAIDCGALDSYPSLKIDTLSRIALHETLHYSSVGPPSLLGELIVDQLNDDDIPAYDPERTHGLNDIDQDNQPGKAETNADNYAWLSIAAFVSNMCTPPEEQDVWDSFFPDDPPDYQ